MSDLGRGYTALVRISDRDNRTLAMPGDTCQEVPDSSLGWLERDGLIQRNGHQSVWDEEVDLNLGSLGIVTSEKEQD